MGFINNTIINHFKATQLANRTLDDASSKFGNQAGQFMKTLTVDLAIQMINGSNASQKVKDLAINQLLARTGVTPEMLRDVNVMRREMEAGRNPIVIGEFNRSVEGLRQKFQEFLRAVNDSIAEGGSQGGTKAKEKGKDATASDFFTALAEAIGNTLQKQADIVVMYGDKVSATVEKNFEEAQKKLAADPKAEKSKVQQDADDAAKDQLMLMQSQMSGESMKMNFLATGLQASLKAVGDALNTMARG